jgi:hypothetical protein
MFFIEIRGMPPTDFIKNKEGLFTKAKTKENK